jgi:hypothetical protein
VGGLTDKSIDLFYELPAADEAAGQIIQAFREICCGLVHPALLGWMLAF